MSEQTMTEETATTPEKKTTLGRIDVHRIPLDQMCIDEAERGRSPEFETNIKKIKDSIRESGQFNPVLAQRGGPDGKNIIIQGVSRYTALCELHEEEPDNPLFEAVLVRFNKTKLNARDRLKLAIAENIARNDLSDLDRAYCVGRLMNTYEMGVKEVAEELGVSIATVGKLQKVLELPHDLQKRIHRNEIKVDVALGLANDPNRDQILEAAKANKNGKEPNSSKRASISKKDIDKAKTEAGESVKPTMAILKKSIKAHAEDKTNTVYVPLASLMKFVTGGITQKTFENKFVVFEE